MIGLAGAAYVAGNGRTALWDRDEPRYAQTSRQMLQSGDWVVPRLLDEPRFAKPVLIYWCQAGAMKLLGDNDFAARLPSTIAMTLTLILVAAATWRGAGPDAALWTTLVLACSGLAIAAAKMALTDAVLLLFVTAAQIGLLAIYTGAGRRVLRTEDYGLNAQQAEALTQSSVLSPQSFSGAAAGRSQFPVVAGMWIAAGLAALTKGPVVLGVMLTTLLALAALEVGRDWRSGRAWREAIRWWPRTRPILGILIIAAICAPWVYAMERRYPGYFLQTLRQQVLERVKTPQEGHKGPPGYYLLTVWATFFPWSLFLPAALVQAWRQRRERAQIRFCLAAVIGPWVMFEVVQTKLPHYLLPVFPPLAFLTADLILGARRGANDELTNRGFVRIVGGWCVLVLVVAAMPWIALRWFALPRAAIASLIAADVLAVVYTALIWSGFRARRPAAGAAVMGLGILALVVVLYVGFLPNAPFLRVSPRVAGILKSHGAREARMIDYKEDTLAWYDDGRIRRQRENDYLTTSNPADWPPWLVVTRQIWDRTPPAIRQRWEIVGEPVHGWAYSDGGRIVDVLVLRRVAP